MSFFDITFDNFMHEWSAAKIKLNFALHNTFVAKSGKQRNSDSNFI